MERKLRGERKGESLRKKQTLTPRMTEQSHKKRFAVIYEILNRRCGLRRREEKTPESRRNFIGFGSEDFCNFVYILHAAGECKFEAIS